LALLCHFTGFATATTIKSQSSSNLELRSFMPGCVRRFGELGEGEFTEGQDKGAEFPVSTKRKSI